MIYCGYQGVGKSTYCKKHPTCSYDLDSSMFTKIDGWEKNYIKLAREISEGGKDVFISAHQVVINYLIANKIPFELLLPAQNEKAWRSRLEFRYNINPIQANMNAILDFDKNFKKDMEFYEKLSVTKHYVSAKVVTDIEDFIEEFAD